MATPKQIVRYGRDEMVQHEDMAESAITTGDLLERTADGVQPHTGGDVAVTYFAVEDAGRGMQAGDVYPAEDRVRYMACSGGKVWARLGSGSVERGDTVSSAGNGLLEPTGEESGNVVGEAAHDADASGGAVYVEIEVSG